MSLTIKDVAKKARVSTATVSLAIQNNKRISAATRQRVLRVVEKLDYRPSHLARGLVMQQSHNIGFVLTDDHFLRTEPFYTHIFLGSEFEARDHEYYILLHTIPHNFDKGKDLPRFIQEHNVDGVIIAGKVPAEIVGRIEQNKLPMVFIDYCPAKGDYSAVLIDNIKGGAEATDHLINHGHQKIAFIGGDLQHPSIQGRFQGYKQAIEQKKISFNNKFVVTSEANTTRETGYNAARLLLSRNSYITAIFCCNDAMAIGAMQYLEDQGLRVPKDISIIGFDNVNAAVYTDPPLTTMHVPKEELGIEAMRLMVDMLKKRIKSTKKVLVPVEIVNRESVKTIKRKP
jgi:LacI family transcriptional regulator